MKIHPLFENSWVVRKVVCVHPVKRAHSTLGDAGARLVVFAATPALHQQLHPVPGPTPDPGLLTPHLPSVSSGSGPTGKLPLKWLFGLCWPCGGSPPSTWEKGTVNLTQQLSGTI